MSPKTMIENGVKASVLQKHLRRDNAASPAEMLEIPSAEWPAENSRILKAWRSRDFFAALWDEHGQFRLSVNRTMIDGAGDWRDGITWDELQRVKRECGFGNKLAVEIYPADSDLVNVANIRHLWFPKAALGFGWGEGSKL